MKVKDLIQILTEIDPELDVLLEYDGRIYNAEKVEISTWPQNREQGWGKPQLTEWISGVMIE